VRCLNPRAPSLTRVLRVSLRPPKASRCPDRVDAVEKVGRGRRVRNDRIEEVCHSNQGCASTGFLNQSCAAAPSKSFFNTTGQNRSPRHVRCRGCFPRKRSFAGAAMEGPDRPAGAGSDGGDPPAMPPDTRSEPTHASDVASCIETGAQGGRDAGCCAKLNLEGPRP
jgi:hypothetical protein